MAFEEDFSGRLELGENRGVIHVSGPSSWI
jgi:hypothetical protein